MRRFRCKSVTPHPFFGGVLTKKIVSILLVLSLSVSLFAGFAFAASGDSSGVIYDFPILCMTSTGGISQFGVSAAAPVFHCPFTGLYTSLLTCCSFFVVLPYPLSADGSFVNGLLDELVYNHPDFAYNHFYLRCFDSQFNQLAYRHAAGTVSEIRFVVPSGTQILNFYFTYNRSSLQQNVGLLELDSGTFEYSDFAYDTSSGGGNYDPSLDQDILAGVKAIAQSLLDLETGPYSSTSGVSLNSDGIVTPSTRNDATLETLLNLIGISSSYSSLAIEQMNLNFGNYFEYHEIEDTSSGTVTVVKNLPSYVNALGMELTDGINKLQRDNLMIYKQGENIEDALFTDKTENQPWSVAQWLKDIYTAISSFFSSFWSPAETDLKTAAEEGLQAAADNGNAASGSQVDEVNSAADAFKSFGSTGNISSGDVMDIFSDGASYDFFSQTTKDNLAYHPPAGGQRNLLRSSAPVPADQSEEEYVDELDDKLCYWREVLGLP